MEFIRLLANNLNTSVGALLFNGSCHMIEHYGATSADGVELFQTWIIFGDPSIQIRTNTPSSMTANYDNTIITGQSTYDVSTPGTANALCALYNPDDSTLIGYGYTDGSGNVTLNLDPVPLVPGQLFLTITAFNKIPIVDTIGVVSPSGPFVTYLSNIIDDASGNNNGQINPGETIDLSVYLKNVGVADAHSVYALVSTTDPDVTVNTDSSNYGNIAAGDSALSITDYDFTVGTVNNEHIIPFDIIITATESTWTGSFSLMAYAPIISQETFAIDDATTGNGNGKWDADEQVKLLFGVKNSGGELAKNVSIDITTTTSGITINDGSAIFGDIDTSATVANTTDDLLATSSASIPTGTAVTIDYTISGDNFTDVTGSVNAIVGQMHYIIFDVDPNGGSGSVMHTVLTNLGYQGDYYTAFSPMVDSLTNYASAFVFAGIYNNNQRIYTDTGAKFANYCQNDGGKFYLEGGDVWYYDPQYGGYNFESLCGIDGTDDGTSDLETIGGVATTFTEGMSFSYTGGNNWVDHLSPVGAGYTIFNNSPTAYVCGIANDVR
ncbi:hypothetical protein KAU43_07130, partial [candidate division WOR-3 bacterium]|nr:hypothetical protein [candidate division WOR-3 bacterium]